MKYSYLNFTLFGKFINNCLFLFDLLTVFIFLYVQITPYNLRLYDYITDLIKELTLQGKYKTFKLTNFCNGFSNGNFKNLSKTAIIIINLTKS